MTTVAPHIIRPAVTADFKCNYCGKGPMVDKGFDPRWNAYFYQCAACKGGLRVRTAESPPRDPEDPSRYVTGGASVDDVQRALIEQWAYNSRTTMGHRMKVPVGLYDTLKANGVDVKDMEPILPTVF